MLYIFTIILISLGSLIMLTSIIRFHRIMCKCRDETYKLNFARRKMIIFISCQAMMCSFLAGYGVVLFFVLNREFLFIFFVVSLILFFGAIFVITILYAIWLMNLSLSAKNNELMELLVTSIEMKDIYTKGHSHHVADVVDLFYEYLPAEYKAGLNRFKLRDAAILHDIGKIGVPDSVLKKPCALDDSEWQFMRQHPSYGKFILDKTFFSEISDWVFYHHERMDGSGYYHLQGEQIPLEARIIALADAFSALSTDRVYRKRFSHDQAIEILEKGSGTHFDPKLMASFKKIPEEALDAIYEKYKTSSTKVLCPEAGGDLQSDSESKPGNN